MGVDYAVVDVSDERGSLTRQLGCTHTAVEVVRFDDRMELSSGLEQVCIPLAIEGPVWLDGEEIPPFGVGHLPAANASVLSAEAVETVLVVSAPANGGARSPTVVDLDACEFAVPGTSDIPIARLTEPLGTIGMKVNARTLAPGQHVPYHTEGSQEELFVPVRGPASMRIDDEYVEMPVGSIARVGPAVPRSALNDGDDEALWVMIGAPPTGGPDEWDPGAEILN